MGNKLGLICSRYFISYMCYFVTFFVFTTIDATVQCKHLIHQTFIIFSSNMFLYNSCPLLFMSSYSQIIGHRYIRVLLNLGFILTIISDKIIFCRNKFVPCQVAVVLSVMVDWEITLNYSVPQTLLHDTSSKVMIEE